MRSTAALLVSLVGLGAPPTVATAQVRTDAELNAGVTERVLAQARGGEASTGPGPAVEASVHVAVLPLIRLGLYGHLDSAVVSGGPTRSTYSSGADARLLLPWIRGDARAYVRLGIGEALETTTSYGGPGAFAPSSRGRFTEVPVAVGVYQRVARKLWISAEAGVRLGGGFEGGAYSRGVVFGRDVLCTFGGVGVVWGR